MSEYNGEQLAIESADALWTALQRMNLTTLDPSYRPSVSLAHQSAGTPYTAVLDALRAVLTVIVSVDPWLTHVTSHAQVADSIIDALCESGETVAYHLRWMRRECIDVPAVTLTVDRLHPDFATATVRGVLDAGGTGAEQLECEYVAGGYPGTHVVYGDGNVRMPNGRERLFAGSWIALADAIARHYRVTGEVKVCTQGDPRETLFSVAYGDAEAANAPA